MRAEPLLRFDPRFTHLVVRRATAFLVGDEAPLVFDDPLSQHLLPLFDGTRTAPEVARTLEDLHRAEIVHFAILRLLEAGVVREVAGGPGGNEPATEMAGLGGALRRLWEARGAVALVDVPREAWNGPGGCTLRLVEDYLVPELAPPGDRRVLLASPAATRVWVGPVLGADGSCAGCLQARLRLNLTGLAVARDEASDAAGELRILRLAAAIPREAWEALAALLPTTSVETGRLLGTLTVARLGGAEGSPPHPGEAHPVPRLPGCPRCGTPGTAHPGAAVALQPRRRVGSVGGGFRTVPPAATLAAWGHLVSPLTGVVRHVERLEVPGAACVHVYTAGHAHHHGRGGLRAVRDGRRDPSGGKGRTDEEARASALCESLERFSSVYRGDEAFRVARASELDEDAAFRPNELMHFSAAQFAAREAWNREHGRGFQAIPEPYADEPIAWSPARSLVTGEERLVPSAFLYYGFRGPGDRFCDGDSNGLAGGNCLEEAVLQGFLELVERDAVALWWYARARRPAVSLSSADDPWIQAVAESYDALGRDLWALDLTTDLGIPTHAAVSARRGEAAQDILLGFGAHLDPRIALVRALTEVNQMLPAVLDPPEARRRRLLPDFPDALRWWDEATLASEPYLAPALGPAPAGLPPAPPAEGDLRDDIEACLRRACAVGCDVLVHDLTRAEVGFPVVKVIVPGLRHFWRRLGPGRLYDVPPRLGWIPARLAESEVNPWSVFV